VRIPCQHYQAFSHDALDAEAVENGEVAEVLFAYVFLLEDDSG
jgi:hypothetical protein